MKENRYDLTKIHKFAMCNRGDLEKAELCGCFYCRNIYRPSEIKQWMKEHTPDGSPRPDTAICPYCGIDSVIAERDDLKITPKLLMDMYNRWFEESKPEFEHDVLPKNIADKLRADFIEKHTDSSFPFFNSVLEMTEHSDGLCYSGYIWEVIRTPRVIERSEAITILRTKGEVFVMWDIRTMENVEEEYRYKVPKDMIIKVRSNVLAKQLEYGLDNRSDASFVPHDFYVFDETLEWYIAFTAEFHPNAPNSLMCLTNLP